MRQDTERHEEKKEKKSGKERNESEQVGEEEKKRRAKKRNEQASIPYVRVSAQQREIKHRSVTKTAETLSLLVQERE
jgi:nucleoid-associated protein YgaU